MWDIRLYALLCCTGALARWSYRSAIEGLDPEVSGSVGFVLFWVPLVGVVVIAGSYLWPAARRRWGRR
jgi:hypothetical protein